MPLGHGWRVDAVIAPTAEVTVDDAVRTAVVRALAARGALVEMGSPLTVTVLKAEWVPTRRSGDQVLWEATLSVKFEADGRTGVRTRTRTVAGPEDAAAARSAREGAFEVLARQVAEDGVSWLTS